MNQEQLNAIKDVFDHYHKSVEENPDLYHYKNGTRNYVQIYLPNELAEFRNAAAGGGLSLRRRVEDTDLALEKIFMNIENLAKFISESECDLEGVAFKPKKKKSKPTTDYYKIPATNNVQKIFGKAIIMDLIFQVGGVENFRDYISKISVGQFAEDNNLTIKEKL